MSNAVMLQALSTAMCSLGKAQKALEKALEAGGVAGKNIELQTSETHIQWRLVGDEQWIDLIALSELQGAYGNNGKSAFELAQDNGFEGTIEEWLLSLVGAKGDAGNDGTNGKSAFQIALDNGFSGTAGDWLASLKGERGDAGNDGDDGVDGKSAYHLALDAGFVGTLEQWLATLKGAEGEEGEDGSNGKSAYQIALDNGFVGSESAWLNSLKGAPGSPGEMGDTGQTGNDGNDGKSAYQLALDNGFVGTLAQWLASLKGAPGTPGEMGDTGPNGNDGIDGKSAYQVALDNGFVGTQAQWLASLKGAPGTSGEMGDSGANGNDGIDGITPGLHYKFNSNIGGAPGSNKFTVDNATLGSITTLRLSIYRAFETGPHNGSIIYSWDDSTNPVKGQLRFTSKNNPDRFIEFNITGAINIGGSGEYTVIPVTFIGGAIFANNEEVVATFNRTGNVGNAGTTGSAGTPATITGATVVGLAPGAAPTVTLGGTASARTFAFGIPSMTTLATTVYLDSVNGNDTRTGTTNDNNATTGRVKTLARIAQLYNGKAFTITINILSAVNIAEDITLEAPNIYINITGAAASLIFNKRITYDGASLIGEGNFRLICQTQALSLSVAYSGSLIVEAHAGRTGTGNDWAYNLAHGAISLKPYLAQGNVTAESPSVSIWQIDGNITVGDNAILAYPGWVGLNNISLPYARYVRNTYSGNFTLGANAIESRMIGDRTFLRLYHPLSSSDSNIREGETVLSPTNNKLWSKRGGTIRDAMGTTFA